MTTAEASTAVYGDDRQRLRDVLLKTLRREICSDDSFHEKVEEYNQNPTKAALLTGLIVCVVDTRFFFGNTTYLFGA